MNTEVHCMIHTMLKPFKTIILATSIEWSLVTLYLTVKKLHINALRNIKYHTKIAPVTTEILHSTSDNCKLLGTD